MSNLAYVEKKARGCLTAPACLSTCFKMVSAFFRGEPLGYPWEGGWASAGLEGSVKFYHISGELRYLDGFGGAGWRNNCIPQ